MPYKTCLKDLMGEAHATDFFFWFFFSFLIDFIFSRNPPFFCHFS